MPTVDGFWVNGLQGTPDNMNACLLLVNTYANIPAAATYKRCCFWATDQNKLYYSDGASWNELTPPASMYENGGANEISLAGLDGEPSALATHKGLTTGVHGVGSDYLAKAAGSQYTAVNKAGDTMTGNLVVDGIVLGTGPNVGTSGAIRARADSGDNPVYLQFLNNALSAEWGNIGVNSSGLMSLAATNMALAGYKIGTYTGNGSGASRQITTGFTGKFGIVKGPYDDVTTSACIWFLPDLNDCIWCRSDGSNGNTISCVLHASDGFNVGNSNNMANRSGVTYDYIILG